MKNKYSRVFLFLVISVLTFVICFYIYAYIMGRANQRMPESKVPSEFEKFEYKIKKQLRSNNGGFEPIETFKMDNCNASINLKLYVENDSINKNNMNEYLGYISNNVNDLLKNKKCFDSLKIKYSFQNERDSAGKLIFHKISYPIK